MKKNLEQQKNENAQANKQEKMAVENLKYEVGQEMGINPKTKNKKS